MKVGVLGGTRFIGVHLVRALLERGDEPVVLNRGLSRRSAPCPPIESIRGDRRDPRALDRLLERPLDALIDLCGYSPLDVEPVLARRGRFGAYAFISTSSVYRVPVPVPYDENAPLRNEPGTYGGDKRAAEELVLASSAPGRPSVVLRPQAVTGPWGADQALYALRRAAAGVPILLRPGTERRLLCPVWVGDVVDAALAAVTTPQAAGRAFDVAGPDAVDALGFAAAAALACGGRAETRLLPSERAGDSPLGLPWLDHDLAADGSRAREILGLKPRPLDETLAAVWAWAGSDASLRKFVPARGERDAASGRPTPRWRRAAWRLEDALRVPLRAARESLRRAR